MGTLKKSHRQDVLVTGTEFLFDENLSLRDKGMLATLLACTDKQEGDEVWHGNNIEDMCCDNDETLRQAFESLVKHNYVLDDRDNWVTLVSDHPQREC